jgi:hypothetical protein
MYREDIQRLHITVKDGRSAAVDNDPATESGFRKKQDSRRQ